MIVSLNWLENLIYFVVKNWLVKKTNIISYLAPWMTEPLWGCKFRKFAK